MPFDTYQPKTPGGKIRQARNMKKFSLDYLAELSGVSRPTIARIEKDEYKRLPVDIIEKLLPYLDLTMEEVKEEPIDVLDHLPPYLREFVLDPENADFIEYCYLEKRRKELENKMHSKE
ncbi:MAG: Helix-turn-helix domain [Firmicutes bacterium]|nr:Helix-turn-helix domain [Bacillota bacterium]